MGSNYKLTYGVDLVFCIDVTMSMDHVLDTVKNNALRFYQDFQVIMKNKHKTVSELRIRIIAFRDYYYDREQAMLVTDFFHLPDQAADFKACLTSIEASGGGDCACGVGGNRHDPSRRDEEHERRAECRRKSLTRSHGEHGGG